MCTTYLICILEFSVSSPVAKSHYEHKVKKEKERNQGQFSASIISRVWELQNENKYDEEIWVL